MTLDLPMTPFHLGIASDALQHLCRPRPGRLWGPLPGSTYPLLAMLSAGIWLGLIRRITRAYQEMETPKP